MIFCSKIKKFKDGIFRLNTRRFGRVAEIMISYLFNCSDSNKKQFDLYDESNNKIEVKFAVARSRSEPINRKNIIKQIFQARKQMVLSKKECAIFDYDCNIEQIKPSYFDFLYYGIFYCDIVEIYKIEAINVPSIQGWSDKQHGDSDGKKVPEGQFHINKATIMGHQSRLVKYVRYEELYRLFKEKQNEAT